MKGLEFMRNLFLFLLLIDAVFTAYGSLVGVITGIVPWFCLPFMFMLGLIALPLLYHAYFYGFAEEYPHG